MSNPSLTFKIAVTKRIIDDPKCVYGTTDWLTRHNPLVLDVLNEMESTEITLPKFQYLFTCLEIYLDPMVIEVSFGPEAVVSVSHIF